MKVALTVHNKNLRIKMKFLLKEKQQIAVLNTCLNAQVQELASRKVKDVIDGKPVVKNFNGAAHVPLMSLDLSSLSMKENKRMSTLLELSPTNTCKKD